MEDWLTWAEYWFNTTFNASTQISPFQTLYGRPPLILFKGEMYPSKVAEVQSLIATRDKVLIELKINLSTALQHRKYFSYRHPEMTYEVGD